jgi:hypothetical protein
LRKQDKMQDQKSGLLALVFPVVGANVGGELAVPLQFNDPQDLPQGLANRDTGGLEEPGALGAAPASAAGFFNPYQLTRHVGLDAGFAAPPQPCRRPWVAIPSFLSSGGLGATRDCVS